MAKILKFKTNLDFSFLYVAQVKRQRGLGHVSFHSGPLQSLERSARPDIGPRNK